MPDEIGRFQVAGPSWSERARAGELKAVLAPRGSERANRFLHATNLVAARRALGLAPRQAVLIDFGCGTGRFVRFFGAKGHRVIGTEITHEMLDEAMRLGLPRRSLLLRTDGILIPARDSSVDLIWCSGVLRFSLFIEDPVYRDIASEMYRVLKPGGSVVNLEIYVDRPPEVFLRDFEDVGFVTKQRHVIHRCDGRLERFFGSRYWPIKGLMLGAQISAGLRLLFDRADRPFPGLRDYLFVWSKPKTLA